MELLELLLSMYLDYTHFVLPPFTVRLAPDGLTFVSFALTGVSDFQTNDVR
jgi:hypothetical protein